MWINPAWEKKNLGQSLGQNGWLCANSQGCFLYSPSLTGFLLSLPFPFSYLWPSLALMWFRETEVHWSPALCSHCCLVDMQTTARWRPGQNGVQFPVPSSTCCPWALGLLFAGLLPTFSSTISLCLFYRLGKIQSVSWHFIDLGIYF